jgi:hypothetical protein
MARVWADSRHAGTDLLMLLAIADFADDDGNAYPAVGTLAAKCRMGARNAIYILRALEASGELQILINQGPKGANRYRIVLDALGVQPTAPLQHSAPLQSSVATPATHCTKPLQPIAPEPSLTIKEPPESAKRRGRSKSEELTFTEWHSRWTASKAEGERFLRHDDPLHAWAAEAGISYGLLNLAFCWFREHFTQDNHKKKQKDWRATFRKYVREDYCRLWTCRDGVYRLTAKGKTLAIRHGEDPEMACGAGSADSDWTASST